MRKTGRSGKGTVPVGNLTKAAFRVFLISYPSEPEFMLVISRMRDCLYMACTFVVGLHVDSAVLLPAATLRTIARLL